MQSSSTARKPPALSLAIVLTLLEANAIFFAMLGRDCTTHGFDAKEAAEYLFFLWYFAIFTILPALVNLIIFAAIAALVYLVLKRLPLNDPRWILGILGLAIVVPLCFALFTPNALHPRSCGYP